MVILKRSVTRLSQATLARFAYRIARTVGLGGTPNVLLTSNAEMKSLNKRFRGKNFPTDVLSFPPARGLPSNFKGEIAISVELAARNARRMGHSLAAEVKILTLHGVLHLAGYDHEQDDGAMARREQSLRNYFRLPIGLIERMGPDQHGGRETVKARVGTTGRKRFPPSVTRPVRERS